VVTFTYDFYLNIQLIHHGNANFVSFVDYLAGRGFYRPSLPPTYQRKKKVSEGVKPGPMSIVANLANTSQSVAGGGLSAISLLISSYILIPVVGINE
jgi:hypothetical protein